MVSPRSPKASYQSPALADQVYNVLGVGIQTLHILRRDERPSAKVPTYNFEGEGPPGSHLCVACLSLPVSCYPSYGDLEITLPLVTGQTGLLDPQQT